DKGGGPLERRSDPLWGGPGRGGSHARIHGVGERARAVAREIEARRSLLAQIEAEGRPSS
ncbi:MAG: hypothetical protein M3Q49_16380, partial [Actinomycetota bacterium]|nr:hypothetical protein [Actinomycetota bacterium]